jgi:hypothetical protein
MKPPSIQRMDAGGILAATALVVAGNRQILGHALAALAHFDTPTEKAILVVSSASMAFREAVLTSAAANRWAAVFCALASDQTHQSPRRSWTIWGSLFIRHLREVHRCLQFMKQVARLRTAPLRLVISGFYGHPLDRSACTLIPHQEFVLVDDGNMTREVARQRPTEMRAGFQHALRHNSTLDFSGWEGRIKLFLFKQVAGVRDAGSPAITYFTHYHDLALTAPDRLIAYAPAREAEADSVASNAVHFLGMPALKKQIVDPAHFVLLLEAVAKRFRGAEFHYYGHPSEGEAEFQLVRRWIPYAQIHDNQAPYEQEYLQMARVPGVVAAFYSSTSFNLAAQRDLKSRLELLEIPDRWILSASRRERVRCIYQDAQINPQLHWIPFDLIEARDGAPDSSQAPRTTPREKGLE